MTELLITRLGHEKTVSYLFNWSKDIIKKAETKGIKVFDLAKEKAKKSEMIKILKKRKIKLIILNGHHEELRAGTGEGAPIAT